MLYTSRMHSYFDQKTVVVTGAAGFVGSHLCDHLLAAGARVIGVDNFITGQEKNLSDLQGKPGFQFIKADVNLDPSVYLTAEKIDLVLHFASPASPPLYQKYPVETYLVNSQATHLLLQFLKQNHPQARFLFASTSEIYGNPQEHPQVEGYWGNVNPNGPRSCYDEAKRLGETICGVHQRDLGMDVRIVRIFNTYGPRMNPEDGRVIPQFVTEALAGKPFTIQGDGSQTRSYCYVEDLVKGILALAASDQGNGQTVNLGNPEEFTILETARLIDHAINGADHQPEMNFRPLPQDDPLRRRPDISKAQSLLNWQPSVSFAEGLQQTIAYFREMA